MKYCQQDDESCVSKIESKKYSYYIELNLGNHRINNCTAYYYNKTNVFIYF